MIKLEASTIIVNFGVSLAFEFFIVIQVLGT